MIVILFIWQQKKVEDRNLNRNCGLSLSQMTNLARTLHVQLDDFV